MSDSLLVILDDVVAGTLTRLRGGRLRFDYDAAYQEQPGHTPLSLSMPIQVTSHPDQAISPWLWGLLPDNDGVLGRWAREFHVSASSPFSLLATPIGEDCAGAVRFAPPDELDRVLSRSGEVAWLSEQDIAERLRELRADSTASIARAMPSSCARARRHGSGDRSPDSSASPVRRPRRRCCATTDGGASRRARSPPRTSSSRPLPVWMITTSTSTCAWMRHGAPV